MAFLWFNKSDKDRRILELEAQIKELKASEPTISEFINNFDFSCLWDEPLDKSSFLQYLPIVGIALNVVVVLLLILKK